MNQTRQKANRNQSISRILMLGLIVLIISVGICTVHVLDVRNCFSRVTDEEIDNNMQNTLKSFGNTIEQNVRILENIALLIQEPSKENKEGPLLNFVAQYNAIELFDRVYYISSDGEVYLEDRTKVKLDSEIFARYFSSNQVLVQIDKSEEQGNDDGVIFYVVPVLDKDEPTGYVLAVNSFHDIFDVKTFADMYKNGDLFLIGQDGSIYAQKALVLNKRSEQEADSPNLFVRMSLSCGEEYYKKDIEKIKPSLIREKAVSGEYLDHDRVAWGYQIRPVSEAEGLYFAYIFRQSTYYNSVDKVVKKALITAVLILFLTIAMIVYMWATSKLSNDMISRLAYDDIVTGGKNDKYFVDVADYTVFHENHNIPYLLVRFDIVNFRYINEAYGHARADSLLKLVIEESAKIFNDKELCCRMTADQFLLLARNDKAFQEKYDNLMFVLNEKAKDLGVKFPIKLKSGIYPIKNEDAGIGVAIDRANAARKTINGDDKLTVATYSEKIIKQMYTSDKIESEMESALASNEFKVYIQPKWNLSSDKIYGGEALVRWIKPDGSRVFPDEFIPIFERNGFVERLDMYMLEEVCKYMRTLIDDGKKIFPVSVNQSRILLHNPEYLNMVSKILERYRIPPGYIELEVTETVFQGQRDVMINIVNRLRELDVHVSMDDFGSGYSSLNMLKDVPFDVIKIDREFFSESITSDSSILILTKIVEMAEGLGIRVLCEGVETPEQVELLKGIGVSFVQGYFYSKPMPVEEFIDTYCKENKDGKEYYDDLFAKAKEAREKKIEHEKQSQTVIQDASSAVKQFKQSYKPKEKKAASETKKDAKKSDSAPEGEVLPAGERGDDAGEAKEDAAKTRDDAAKAKGKAGKAKKDAG